MFERLFLAISLTFALHVFAGVSVSDNMPVRWSALPGLSLLSFLDVQSAEKISQVDLLDKVDN